MLRPLIIPLVLLVAAAGCATSREPLDGPAAPARVRIDSWSFQGTPGRRVLTPHYVIYTTINDDELISDVGQLMEGAFAQYRLLAPGVPPTSRPMECYLFQSRHQWAAFTRGRTGADAAIYLQINRGGYTVGDWYVAYFIGDVGTFSVAAHEGFHQYVARHFKSRLPPFLEEGLACMFEEVRWDSPAGHGAYASPDLPRWSFSRNRSRLLGLRNAVDGGNLIPLPDLVAMHAGQVVDQPPERIEAFYAQSWAFAKFMWDADAGLHRPALRRILTDAAAGALYPGDNLRSHDDGLWDPQSARPLLEHYLGTPLESLDRSYRRYVNRVVADGYRQPTQG